MKSLATVLCVGMLALACPPGRAAQPQLATSSGFALALKADGTVLAWGRNDGGQLGNGQAAIQVSARRIAALDNVRSVSVGSGHAHALRGDGTLWSWGNGSSGALGDGTDVSKAFPVKVLGFSGTVSAVSSGLGHSLALTQDGAAWSFGWNYYGQLGNGQVVDQLTARKIAGLPTLQAVSAGAIHSLALDVNGAVWAWGDNGFGQLGTGISATRALVPVKLATLAGITAISSSSASNLALDNLGRVWAWGRGTWGAMGDGSTTDRMFPGLVPGLPPIAAIQSGTLVNVAIARDGGVWVWGSNEMGQFGDDQYGQQFTPVRVAGLLGLQRFSIANAGVAAVDALGSVLTWGRNGSGQLGSGDTLDRTRPGAVQGLPRMAQVAAGSDFCVAIGVDGSLWAWGSNGLGQLADGSVAGSSVPVRVVGMPGVESVAAGQAHNLALGGDGRVWGWGRNGSAQLGDASGRDALVPQPIAGLPPMAAVAAAGDASFAIDGNGTLWSWGDNGMTAKLGTGNPSGAALPAVVTAFRGVAAVSARYGNAIALTRSGGVWAWGDNRYGQAGNSSIGIFSNPAPVPDLPRITRVSTSGFHQMVLDVNGNVWSWGLNNNGQVGDGARLTRLLPVRLPAPNSVVAISAGDFHSCALDQQRRLWTWGSNAYGELGRTTADTYSTTPALVPNLSNVASVSCGAYFTLVTLADGSVLGWGRNFEGQIGDGTLVSRPAAVALVNEGANGLLNLAGGTQPPAAKMPSFFVIASGQIQSAGSVVSNTTRFGPADVGKPGSVYVTAMVPAGTLGAAAGVAAPQAKNKMATMPEATSFVPMQLTSSGWQPVVNGQLLPYATGVLGEQLAAQKILDGTNFSDLTGSEFCVGYGSNPTEMAVADRIRAVASVGLTAAPSCTVMAQVKPANCLFDWAEASFPALFAPKGSASRAYSSTYLRYFTQTGATLGVADNRLYYAGPLSANQALNLGAVADWYQTAGCR